MYLQFVTYNLKTFYFSSMFCNMNQIITGKHDIKFFQSVWSKKMSKFVRVVIRHAYEIEIYCKTIESIKKNHKSFDDDSHYISKKDYNLFCLLISICIKDYLQNISKKWMNGFQDNVNLRTSLGLVSDNLLLFQDLSNNLDNMSPYL